AAWRDDDHAVVRHAGRELRFAAGGPTRDSRGNTWTIEGDHATLELESGDTVSSTSYPNALERLWQILHCVNAGDVVASATPRFEFCDSGGASHLGGGSHGSLHAADSLVPLAAVGLEQARELPPERSIEDIAGLCASQLRIGPW
ncbi:MAG: alkaline phosphatase family protein, partial [Gaiellales bacterium]